MFMTVTFLIDCPECGHAHQVLGDAYRTMLLSVKSVVKRLMWNCKGIASPLSNPNLDT